VVHQFLADGCQGGGYVLRSSVAVFFRALTDERWGGMVSPEGHEKAETAASVASISAFEGGAGDEIRTRDSQLGKPTEPVVSPKDKKVTASDSSACASACAGLENAGDDKSLRAIAATLFDLSAEERGKLAAMLLRDAADSDEDTELLGRA
jgi:hypothetical protein